MDREIENFGTTRDKVLSSRSGGTRSLVVLLRAALVALTIGAGLGSAAGSSHAQITNPGNFERLRQETIYQVRAAVAPILARHCRESCEVTKINVDIDEQIGDSEDIGFESVVGATTTASLFVSKVVVDVQIDDRISILNRDRLQAILGNTLRALAPSAEVRWNPVQLPQIGQSETLIEELKRSVQQRVTAALQRVIETYCPDECVLSRVAVDARATTEDQAADVNPREIVRDKSGRGIVRIESVDVELSLDQRLEESDRARIVNVVKAKTRFVEPLNLDVSVTEFPESWAQRKQRLADASADPFGLERLRETLKIFRELAGTKEIISRESVLSSASERLQAESTERTNLREESRLEATSRESSKSQNTASNTSLENNAGSTTLDYAMWIGAGLLLVGLLIAMIMRIAGANRDARFMVASAPTAGGPAVPGSPQRDSTVDGDGTLGYAAGGGASAAVQSAQTKELAARIKRDQLKQDLANVFLESPKVAKETFSRLLQDEGVEETSKYVQIFGQMVVFELLDDPNLQRDLYALSEYYPKSDHAFSTEEEIELLQSLRTRVTANEIRILSRKTMDKFDFLSKLDAGQVFNLIREEKAQVQSIVLTQLDHKRRRAVFEIYEGDAKVALMRELCRADAIPKDYLANVARALQRKVESRPEFDTENLRASDILLDLLEKARLDDQRSLMRDLVRTNSEAARGIKLKLVTIEIMPLLKDGHLLELVLGMEREDLLLFLAGTREHIRELLVTKAPEELAQSWLEELEHVRNVDEQAYRVIELKVLSRIRQLANNGAINLLELNELLFAESITESGGNVSEELPQGFSTASMVA